MQDPAPATPARPRRSVEFSERKHPRYWWYWGRERRYVPDVYGCLRPDEWDLIRAWFDETERRDIPGEMSVPMISVLRGFIMGSGLSSIVQLGHWAGYSTLLLGFTLRRMRRTRALFSVDIDAPMTEFTRTWVERAGLTNQLALHLGDSADPACADAAEKYLGRRPQIVIIDSSHQYAHTLRELDLWYDRLGPGGMLVLHDASDYAATFDGTGKGGVRHALLKWTKRLPHGSAILIGGGLDRGGDSGMAYVDGCGLAIVQKPAPAWVPPRDA